MVASTGDVGIARGVPLQRLSRDSEGRGAKNIKITKRNPGLQYESTYENDSKGAVRATRDGKITKQYQTSQGLLPQHSS